MVYRTFMTARASAYKRRWLRRRPLPLPSVSIGNLAVGGAGKTPVAAWTAAFLARRRLKPGILLRGYRGDEQAVHQRLVPGAIVVADADRVAGAERARTAGGQGAVLEHTHQSRRAVGAPNNTGRSPAKAPPPAVAPPPPA